MQNPSDLGGIAALRARAKTPTQMKEFEDRLDVLKEKHKKIRYPEPTIPEASRMAVIGGSTHTYNGRKYKVHVGPKGGRYILVQKKKVYVS